MEQKQEALEAKTELKTLGVIGYESYGLSSPEAVKNTIKSLKEYDKKYPPENDISRIQEIKAARRKG